MDGLNIIPQQEGAAEYPRFGKLATFYVGRFLFQHLVATDLLAEPKLSPELRNEALYYRAKAYVKQKADKKAMDDFRELAKDTRNPYGAEAKYLVAQSLYDAKEYAAAEKELLNYIEQSTPHAYWLARSFVLLSDVYAATGKDLDARQYLLSLQQNYQGNDDIESMIESRLAKLKGAN